MLKLFRRKAGGRPGGDTRTHYRITVMGPAGVGKTCIISRFLYGKYLPEHNPTIEDMHRGTCQVNGETIWLDILDTTGTYDFPAMKRLAISKSEAFILVYSVPDRATFDQVSKVREQIVEQLLQEGKDPVPMVVVGNKADLEPAGRASDPQITESIVRFDWSCDYVEASAKENLNIFDIFQQVLNRGKLTNARSIL